MDYILFINLEDLAGSFARKEWRNEEAEAEMAVIEAIVRATRSLRMVYDLQPRIRLSFFLHIIIIAGVEVTAPM
jgi:hypothetical protein